MAIKTVFPFTLKEWLDRGSSVVIDVREPMEYEAENIPGAILLPLGNISLQLIPKIQGKKLVLQCHSGVRSRKACEILLAQNPDIEIYNLEGGIVEWIQAGNYVRSSITNK